MATLTLEVFSRFQSATDANKLLYTPIADKLTYNHTRLYTVECEGDVEAARDYMRRVLVDPISQKVEEGGAPALSGELFCISYGIKKGALDLEKEAILTNYRGRSGMPFTITGLTITQNIYVFGTGDKAALAARFCNDVCNPAIHTWSVR
ncbi:MAG: hypothetical protein ACI4XO_05765 [Akkermansia sp.]|nr:hypothetical protein [Akkermansia muciniphila]MCI7699164.1 hypothetical protein [Akkermansia sp.]